jgi:hypothetical protein
VAGHEIFPDASTLKWIAVNGTTRRLDTIEFVADGYRAKVYDLLNEFEDTTYNAHLSAKADLPHDRGGYTPYLFTISDRLEDGWYSGASAELMQTVGTMTLTETVTLLRRPWRMRSDSEHESRLAEKDAELMATAQLLAQLGHAGAALSAREAPDFTVRLRGDELLRIEVSEVVAPESAYHTNAAEDLKIALRDAVDADPAAWPTEAFVSFNFGPMIDRPPPTRKREAILAEALDVLRSGAYRAIGGMRFFDEAHPTLQSVGAWLYVGTLEGNERGHIGISSGAFTFVDTSLIGVARERVEAKRRLRYSGAGTLWLLLPVTDQRGLFHGTVDGFQALSLDIAPFDQVILTSRGRRSVSQPD